MFENKKIVLIVTGGVAAYKSARVARLLMRAGAEVRVVMTANALEFMTEKTFATLTKHAVLTDLFKTADAQVAHIEWADWADLFFVVPATANFIGKLAQGLADDAASTVAIARHTPMLIAPAMNPAMYENPAVQRNLAQLRQDGVMIIEPTEGLLAEGYQGQGRMLEPEELLASAELQLRQMMTQMPLQGQKFLVTAGGTKEALDPVRFIGNHSSGKMGYAVAQALLEWGADVTLITTVNLPSPAGVRVVPVQSAREMKAALQADFAHVNGVVMAAAVADYRPLTVASQKIKKQDGANLEFTLQENPDLLATLGQAKQQQILVGFAAETNDLIEHANLKLTKKNVDLLVANDVTQTGSGFQTDTNLVTFLQPGLEPKPLPILPKVEVARKIVQQIVQIQRERGDIK